MSKDLWIADVERAEDEFCRTDDEAVFRNEMRTLGFTPGEIAEHVDRLRREMGWDGFDPGDRTGAFRND